MTSRTLCIVACVSAVLVLFISCKPQVPNEYLQPDEMEDILYDYHLASGMISEDDDSSAIKKALYESSVLKKHGVTRSEFDTSLVYYSRHSDRFHDIYTNLLKRLNDEAVSLGASAGDLANMGNSMAKGDTANVWKDAMSLVLATHSPYNVKSFYIKADSAYHKGDRIVLSFKTQFVFQDGYKDGVAMLAVKFMNDSVDTQVVHISESSFYSLSVSDDAKWGIKEIRGFLTLQSSPDDSQTTLKLMFADNIRLIRCHVTESAEGSLSNESVDSASVEDKIPGSSSQPTTAPMRELNVQDEKLHEMKSIR